MRLLVTEFEVNVRRELIEKNTPKWWNIRQLTDDHFWEFCDEYKIIVREEPLEQEGYSLKSLTGESFIYIRDDLRGPERTFTQFHEMGHWLLHPKRINFSLGMSPRVEIEADVVAACAMIPRTWLVHRGIDAIVEEFQFPNWIINVRLMIFNRYKI